MKDAFSTTGKRLTWTEIRQRFHKKWVVLIEIDWEGDSSIDFVTARVLAHDRSQDAATRIARDVSAQGKDVACFFAGRALGPHFRLGLMWENPDQLRVF